MHTNAQRRQELLHAFIIVFADDDGEMQMLQPHGEALTFEDGNVTLVGT